MTNLDLSTARAPRKLSALLFAVLIAVAGGALAAPADDIREATKLYEQGKYDAALVKANAALAVQPKDAQARFTKGMILIEQKKLPEAIQIFTGITEDFPELPEPYNNLAALYAMQGNYDKAKAALELAIHTHPTYGTAYENLGDIYAQLARRSYDKAFQLDKTNAGAQSKLALVKSLFPGGKGGAGTIQVASADPAKAPPVATAPPAAPPITKPAEPVKPTPPPVAKVEPTKVEAPKAAPPPAVTPIPAPAKPPPVVASSGDEAAIRSALSAWAAAWAAQDVPGYLAAYGANFETPDGLSRKAWEKQRKERIEAPSSIDVSLSDVKISINGNDATASFRQAYKSDRLATNSNKTVKLSKSGERWLIRSERSGK